MLRSPRPASLIANAQRAWRQSLQLRVVTITLATSGLLVATFGLLVGNMITNGLVDKKTERAQELVTRGTEDASDQLKGLIPNASDPLAITYVKPVVVNLADQDQGSGVTVAIIPGDASTAGLVGLSHPLENAHAQVPDEIKTAVREQGYVHQRLDLSLDGGDSRLYLVFGRELKQSWGIVQLYYFFPLDEEISAAALVTNTITITGIALVIMLALVVSLVTRMVVNPVRVAARTAQRLSNGLLDQRMEVKGEDDLAALAASFNHMAENLQRHILRLEEMSRLQRRFTSDVSHELRTPLTTVRMAADLLFAQRDEFDAPTARSAELLQAELDRFEIAALRAPGDQPVRRRVRGTGRGAGQPRPPCPTRRSTGLPRWPTGPASEWMSTCLPIPSSPRSTCAAWSGSCATSSATPSSTARVSPSRYAWRPATAPSPSRCATTVSG